MPFWLRPIDLVKDAADNEAVRTFAVGYGIYALLSHLAFVPAIVRSLMLRVWISFVLVTIATVISTFYHGCQTFDRCAGFLLPETRFLDHETAPLIALALGWMFLNAHGLRTTRERYLNFVLAALIFQALVVLSVTHFHPYDGMPVFAAAAALLVTATVYYLVFRVEPYHEMDDPDLRVRPFYAQVGFFVGGLIAAAIGLAMFAIPDLSTLLHSNWHVFIALGYALLQESIYGHAPPLNSYVSQLSVNQDDYI